MTNVYYCRVMESWNLRKTCRLIQQMIPSCSCSCTNCNVNLNSDCSNRILFQFSSHTGTQHLVLSLHINFPPPVISLSPWKFSTPCMCIVCVCKDFRKWNTSRICCPSGSERFTVTRKNLKNFMPIASRITWKPHKKFSVRLTPCFQSPSYTDEWNNSDWDCCSNLETCAQGKVQICGRMVRICGARIQEGFVQSFANHTANAPHHMQPFQKIPGTFYWIL